jgi:hypothetical protein
MLCRVVWWKLANVSEMLTASIIRAMRPLKHRSVSTRLLGATTQKTIIEVTIDRILAEIWTGYLLYSNRSANHYNLSLGKVLLLMKFEVLTAVKIWMLVFVVTPSIFCIYLQFHTALLPKRPTLINVFTSSHGREQPWNMPLHKFQWISLPSLCSIYSANWSNLLSAQTFVYCSAEQKAERRGCICNQPCKSPSSDFFSHRMY